MSHVLMAELDFGREAAVMARVADAMGAASFAHQVGRRRESSQVKSRPTRSELIWRDLS